MQLEGEAFARVRESDDPLAREVMAHYRTWWRGACARSGNEDAERCERESSILFDTAAVYLAFSEEGLEMERLGVGVTNEGRTEIDEAAKAVRCATAWKPGGLVRFHELVSRRVAGA